MNEFIILELIPTTSKKETGDIIQLSALKIRDNQIIDRFDYRLDEDKILLKDFIDLISYDKDKFIYKKYTKEIIDDFSIWSLDTDLCIIDNDYTYSYLRDLNNDKYSIFKKLNMEYSDDVIEKIIKKYNLENSDYIVDLLYEALIAESNSN